MKLVYNKEIRDLIKGCKAGKSHAQRKLYELYADKMYLVCLRYARDEMEAEDILQEGFIRIFNKIGTFKGEGSIEGWIRRVIVNIAIRHCQNRNRIQQLVNISDVDEERVEDVVPECDFDLEDLLKMVHSLPDGYQTIFNMFAIEGFSHKEIAEKLGITVGTSKSQVARAREQLKKMIDQHYYYQKLRSEQSAG